MADRLDSWKEIAAYLKRDVTTVRRWEKREGLPVHRHLHERRDSVYAYAAEIDAWWAARRNGLSDNGHGSGDDAVLDDRASPYPRATVNWIAWALAAIFSVTTLVLAVVLFTRTPSHESDEGQRRFFILPPHGGSFDTAVLSPDSRQLAFTAATKDGTSKTILYVQPLDSVARALPDTEGAAFPFWSPTSDALGFFAAGQLWTMTIGGAGPRSIAPAPRGRGGTWNRDGTIVFAPEPEGVLYRIASSGGTATPITTLRDPERGHLWPEFLPDGHRFLYLADTPSTRIDDHHVFVGALDGGEPRRILSAASSVAYSDNGYLLYERERQLLAQPFDASTLAVMGDPMPLTDRVQQHFGAHHKAEFSVASNLLTFRAMQSPASRLIWHNRMQRGSDFTDTPREYSDPTLSPDGRRVALAVFDPQLSRRFGYGAGVRGDIFLFDLADDEAGAPVQLTNDPSADWGPVWSPDGRSLVFSSNRRGPLELFLKDVTTAGSAEVPIATIGDNPVAQSWSPDGRFIVYSAFNPKTRTDLWLLPMAGDRTPTALLQSEFAEQQGQISPDGRWLAYTSDESGQEEVYVQAFPQSASRQRVSNNGGGDPRWSRDGRELFYLSPSRELMAAPVKIAQTVQLGSPVFLFQTDVAPHWYAARNLYEVMRDGRFLMTKPIEDDRALPLTVVLNWVSRVKERRDE